MINWRYHIMSIIAIFLALGLGITIGISLGEDGTVNLGQEGLLDDIRTEIDETRRENNDLSTERSINERYQDQTFPYLVSGKLQGKNIALVSAATVSDEVRRGVSSAIQTAGGQVVSTTILKSDFDAAAVVDQASEALQQYPELAAVEESSIKNLFGGQLSLEIATASPPTALTALQDSLVDSTNGNYELQVDGILLLTQADDSYSPHYSDFEREFILNLKNLGFVIAGGEPADAPRSEVPMFIAMGIPSADNVDSRIGQLSLVYALAGDRDTYGIKPTSDMLIPILRIPVLEEEVVE